MTTPAPTVSSAPAVSPAPPMPGLIPSFLGIARLTLRPFLGRTRLLVFAAMLGVLGVIAYGVLHEHPRTYLRWVTGFYVTFLVPVMAFISAGGALRDDLTGRTIDYVLTRPIRRPVYVLLRFVSHVAAVQVQALLAAAVVIGLGIAGKVPAVSSALPVLVLAQALLVLAFSALGFLCAVITSRYVVVGLLYGLIVEVGVGRIPTQLNRLSMTMHVKGMIDPLLAGTAPVATAPSYAALGVLLAFTGVVLALAAAIFAVRELDSSNDP